MEAKQILYPMIVMFFLTVVVAMVMLKRRIAAMKANHINPQKVALSPQMASLIPDTRASDNFRNLFETPVMFYVALLIIYSAKLGSVAYVILAWLFVVARIVHSSIHCGSNRIIARLYAFLFACTVLSVIWMMIAFDLIIAGRG